MHNRYIFFFRILNTKITSYFSILHYLTFKQYKRTLYLKSCFGKYFNENIIALYCWKKPQKVNYPFMSINPLEHKPKINVIERMLQLVRSWVDLDDSNSQWEARNGRNWPITGPETAKSVHSTLKNFTRVRRHLLQIKDFYDWLP